MSKALPIAIAVILGGAAMAPIYYAMKNPATDLGSKTDKNAPPVAKISYALGYQVTSQTPPEMDIDAFVKGVRDGHARKPNAYTEEELKVAYTAFQEEMVKKQQQEAMQASAKNDSFLAENSRKPGIVTTASGLQYKVVVAGTGKQPTATSTVKVHYKGQLTDGKVFDDSFSRGQPVEFPVDKVIPGWTEGLQTMKAGGTSIFYIPGKLAYGEQGVPGMIPANSTLIFEVKLLEVK